jgi:hypothetical protein
MTTSEEASLKQTPYQQRTACKRPTRDEAAFYHYHYHCLLSLIDAGTFVLLFGVKLIN